MKLTLSTVLALIAASPLANALPAPIYGASTDIDADFDKSAFMIGPICMGMPAACEAMNRNRWKPIASRPKRSVSSISEAEEAKVAALLSILSSEDKAARHWPFFRLTPTAQVTCAGEKCQKNGWKRSNDDVETAASKADSDKLAWPGFFNPWFPHLACKGIDCYKSSRPMPKRSVSNFDEDVEKDKAAFMPLIGPICLSPWGCGTSYNKLKYKYVPKKPKRAIANSDEEDEDVKTALIPWLINFMGPISDAYNPKSKRTVSNINELDEDVKAALMRWIPPLFPISDAMISSRPPSMYRTQPKPKRAVDTSDEVDEDDKAAFFPGFICLSPWGCGQNGKFKHLLTKPKRAVSNIDEDDEF
ncbi:hypothetical protein BJ508DRAFT_11255 [Ascobolus immersus RN42]|uniref:Uncharacterized protein n=1 Tax=Ascobolus immersus RN42 TaxID=1160509 RepID=A0A3N4HUB1_ASCIM|nr:hypothetical protein BJ508DRAFT_11255 [Ascobolus immersus RN42]